MIEKTLTSLLALSAIAFIAAHLAMHGREPAIVFNVVWTLFMVRGLFFLRVLHRAGLLQKTFGGIHTRIAARPEQRIMPGDYQIASGLTLLAIVMHFWP